MYRKLTAAIAATIMITALFASLGSAAGTENGVTVAPEKVKGDTRVKLTFSVTNNTDEAFDGFLLRPEDGSFSEAIGGQSAKNSLSTAAKNLENVEPNLVKAGENLKEAQSSFSSAGQQLVDAGNDLLAIDEILWKEAADNDAAADNAYTNVYFAGLKLKKAGQELKKDTTDWSVAKNHLQEAKKYMSEAAGAEWYETTTIDKVDLPWSKSDPTDDHNPLAETWAWYDNEHDDLTYFGVDASPEFLKFTVKMDNIQKATGNGAPMVAVSIDTDQVPGSGIENAVYDEPGLTQYGVHENAAWERQIRTAYGAGSDYVVLYDNTGNDIATSEDVENIDNITDTMKFRVGWERLGVSRSDNLRFTVATGRSNSNRGGWSWGFIADTLSGTENVFSELQDNIIDHYWDVDTPAENYQHIKKASRTGENIDSFNKDASLNLAKAVYSWDNFTKAGEHTISAGENLADNQKDLGALIKDAGADVADAQNKLNTFNDYLASAGGLLSNYVAQDIYDTSAAVGKVSNLGAASGYLGDSGWGIENAGGHLQAGQFVSAGDDLNNSVALMKSAAYELGVVLAHDQLGDFASEENQAAQNLASANLNFVKAGQSLIDAASWAPKAASKISSTGSDLGPKGWALVEDSPEENDVKFTGRSLGPGETENFTFIWRSPEGTGDYDVAVWGLRHKGTTKWVKLENVTVSVDEEAPSLTVSVSQENVAINNVVGDQFDNGMATLKIKSDESLSSIENVVLQDEGTLLTVTPEQLNKVDDKTFTYKFEVFGGSENKPAWDENSPIDVKITNATDTGGNETGKVVEENAFVVDTKAPIFLKDGFDTVLGEQKTQPNGHVRWRWNDSDAPEGKWVYSDNLGDERADLVDDDHDEQADLTKLKVWADSSYLYFEASMADITKETGSGAPFVTVTLDTENHVGGNKWLPQMIQAWTDENAKWERTIYTRFGSGSPTVGVFDTSWSHIEAATDTESIDKSTDTIKFRVGWKRIFSAGTDNLPDNIRMTVATARATSGDKTQKFPKISGFPLPWADTCNVIDTITDEESTWAEVKEGRINYYLDFRFGSDGSITSYSEPMALSRLKGTQKLTCRVEDNYAGSRLKWRDNTVTVEKVIASLNDTSVVEPHIPAYYDVLPASQEADNAYVTYLPTNERFTEELKLKATDWTGNSTTVSVENILIDDQKPEIEFGQISGENEITGEAYYRDLNKNPVTNDTTPKLDLTITDPGYPENGLGVWLENVSVYLDSNDNLKDGFVTVLDHSKDWNPSTGLFENTVPKLSDGTYYVTVEANDNLNKNVTATTEFTVDDTSPSLSSKADTSFSIELGSKANPKKTNEESLSLSGTAESGAIIEVLVNGEVKARTKADSPWNATVSPDEGTNKITARAIDPAGNVTSILYGYIVSDRTAPSITVDEPAEGELLGSRSVTVSGSVSDNTTSVSELTVAGDTVPVATENGSFSTSVTVDEGTRTINLAATDEANNTSSESVSVTVDATRPEAEIASPTTGIMTKKGTIEVQGKAYDEVTSIAEVTLNGESVSLDADGTFSKSVSLDSGTNTITLSAKDEADHYATDSVTLVSDTAEPSVSITEPEDKMTTSSTTITVKGKVTDEPAETGVTVRLNAGETSKEISLQEDGSFETTIPLPEGETIITVSATDEPGNTNSESVTVTRTVTPWPLYAAIAAIIAIILAAIAILRRRSGL